MPSLGRSDLAHLARIRQDFLDAAVQLEPQLVTRLRAVLPSARERWWRSKGRLLTLPSSASTEFTPPEVLDALRKAAKAKARVVPFPPLPPSAAVLPGIARWVKRFRLDGSTGAWIEQAATITLYRWQLSGRRWQRKLVAPPTSFKLGGPPPQAFGFTYQAIAAGIPMPRFWFPPAERWEDFQREIRRDVARVLEIHLTSYEERTRKRFQAAGWTPLQRKRKPDLHYRWTVLYQIRDWSFSKIAKRELGSPGDSDDPDRRKIEDAVTRTAHSLGLRLRPAEKRVFGRRRESSRPSRV